jgi:hypothetical protein
MIARGFPILRENPRLWMEAGTLTQCGNKPNPALKHADLHQVIDRLVARPIRRRSVPATSVPVTPARRSIGSAGMASQPQSANEGTSLLAKPTGLAT